MFELLVLEREELIKLYEPLNTVVAEDQTGVKTGFELSVRQVANVDAWVKRGKDLFDKRRAVIIADEDQLKALDNTLFDPWKAGDIAAIHLGLDALIKTFGENPSEIDATLVSHASRERMYDWLFSTDQVSLEYGLRFNGSDLEVLSPGTRGIVLLVLYLAMDRQDRRPLIIDQPEGNLDNSSVYKSLVPFLRKAKQDRQIIIVTHNPNLIVTTDADQVIVATATREGKTSHPSISYMSGSLENVGVENAIREQAVRLLEGGTKPFKTRENRYSLPKG